MPRTCIICGAPANSREHIFPAALGGLRVNRGIYCETHNNGFSDLANVLVEQFGMWNALLGVRDRDRRPRVLNIATPEGEDVIVTAGRVRRADPTVGASEGRIHLQLTLGGPDGLPAIGYVTLTFFAHHFGDMARQDGLASIKAFIQGQGENQFVWWESEATTRGLPTNPFPFGHTIILTTSAASGEARAVISLFQTLTFGVALGRVVEAPDRTITVFIDPHAERQPLDTQELHSDTVDLVVKPPRPMHVHLQRLIYEGQGQVLMQDLMARMERWNFENEMSQVLSRLNAARELPVVDRRREVQSIAEEERARIYRVMLHVARDLRQRTVGQPGMGPISNALDLQVTLPEDGGSDTNPAVIAISRVIGAYTIALDAHLEREPVDMEYLWNLFSGSTGTVLATRTMVDPIMAAIGAPRNWEGWHQS